MTPDTKAIRERAEKATPGPWTREAWLEILKSAVQADANEYDFNKEAFRILAHWPTKEVLQDADFIAHARTDIPALLAEVDRLTPLEEEVKRLREVLKPFADLHDEIVEVAAKMNADVLQFATSVGFENLAAAKAALFQKDK